MKKITIARDDEEIELNEREQKIYEEGISKGWEMCGLLLISILIAFTILIHVFT